MGDIKKEGYFTVKEDGLRAWMWSKRYGILRDQTLTLHRNEVYCRNKEWSIGLVY
jgi:hypothetical protein